MPEEGTPMNIFWRTMFNGTMPGNTRQRQFRELTENDYEAMWPLWSDFISVLHLREEVHRGIKEGAQTGVKAIGNKLFPPWASQIFSSVVDHIIAPALESQVSSSLEDLGSFLLDNLNLSSLGNLDSSSLGKFYETFLGRSPETIIHLAVCLWQRRIYITKNGVLGLAPSGTKVGDEVHVVLGSSAPFILRRAAEDTTSYVVIGNCYQYNIMKGEALERGGLEAVRTITIR
ncbi:hypothetical protein B0T25DRAFT_550779 [Lasiosphaeria hispida]|uniref:Uncharacterized protein n=1 Tax=Lasiosphaeria hispida TaxID=260671 RepID=A0AAJ0HAH2_9PEZI|nr:hypothetical protein B0T25DRAFT_550779 [Lasiosphaeria hispida]